MKKSLLIWGFYALCPLLTLAGVGLYLVSLGHGQIPRLYPNMLVIAVIFPLVGSLIVARQPRNPIGWLFCGLGLSQASSTLVVYYATYSLLVKPGSWPGGTLAAWLSAWVWQPGFALLPLLLLLFPNGRLLSSRWRWVAWCVVGGAILGTINNAILSWPLRGLYLVLHADDHIPGTSAARLAELMSVVGFLGAGAGLLLRFWCSTGIERQQLKWFSFAAGLVAFFQASIIFTVPNDNNLNQQLLNLILIGLETISLAGMAVAIGIAILRYRLYDIDLIIRRTLVYSVLSGLLVLFYFGSVVLFQQLLRPFVSQGETPLVTVASTLVLAALFTPLRRRVQAQIDRRFYRRKYNAEQVLTAFGATVRNETDLQKLSEQLVLVVQKTVQPTRVTLCLRVPAQTRSREVHHEASF